MCPAGNRTYIIETASRGVVKTDCPPNRWRQRTRCSLLSNLRTAYGSRRGVSRPPRCQHAGGTDVVEHHRRHRSASGQKAYRSTGGRVRLAVRATYLTEGTLPYRPSCRLDGERSHATSVYGPLANGATEA